MNVVNVSRFGEDVALVSGFRWEFEQKGRFLDAFAAGDGVRRSAFRVMLDSADWHVHRLTFLVLPGGPPDAWLMSSVDTMPNWDTRMIRCMLLSAGAQFARKLSDSKLVNMNARAKALAGHVRDRAGPASDFLPAFVLEGETLLRGLRDRFSQELIAARTKSVVHDLIVRGATLDMVKKAWDEIVVEGVMDS